MKENPYKSNRTGEKVGWIGGGTGSVLWVGILAIILLSNGKYTGGVLGIMIMSLGLLSVFFISPWRFPGVKYRLLFIPLYLVLLISIIWAVTFLEDSRSEQFNPWMLFLLLPLITGFILPIFTIGKRRWNDGPQV